jgi:hypothetical protein
VAAAIAFDPDGTPVSCAHTLSQKAMLVQAKAISVSMAGTRRRTMELKTHVKFDLIFILIDGC